MPTEKYIKWIQPELLIRLVLWLLFLASLTPRLAAILFILLPDILQLLLGGLSILFSSAFFLPILLVFLQAGLNWLANS